MTYFRCKQIREHGGNRVGVVIAELYSIADNRSVLEHKRNLRTIPIIYANVFSRAAKSHTEQQNLTQSK